MFLTEKNFKKGLLLVSLVMMVFLTSCVEMLTTQPTSKMDVPAPQAPQLKTFQTSAEYTKAGKASFDAKQFDEAQAYLSDAVRLDQKNQAAHLLLGVTYVKLGKGADARREFDKTLQIDAKTGDGETAKSWLKRLDNPVAVGILPPNQNWSVKIILGLAASALIDNNEVERVTQNIQNKLKNNINGLKNYYYITLSKTLSDCKFYSINEIGKGEHMELEQNTIRETIAGKPTITAITKTNFNENSIINNAKSSNIKILIKCIIDDHLTTEKGLFATNSSATIGYNIELYSVKESRIIKHIKDKVTIDNTQSSDNLESLATQAEEKLFKKMALEIHNALL